MSILKEFLTMVRLGKHLNEDELELVKLGDAEPKDLLQPFKTGDMRIDAKISSVPTPTDINMGEPINTWVYKFYKAIQSPNIANIIKDMFTVEDVEDGTISTIGDNWGRAPVNKAGAQILMNLFKWYKSSDKTKAQFPKLVGTFPEDVRKAIKSSVANYKSKLIPDSDGVNGLEMRGDSNDVKMFIHLLTDTSGFKFDPQNEGFVFKHLASMQMEFIERELFMK